MKILSIPARSKAVYCSRVPSAGIEPAFPPSEGDVLSIERRGVRYCSFIVYYFDTIPYITTSRPVAIRLRICVGVH